MTSTLPVSQDVFVTLRDIDFKTTEYLIAELWLCQSCAALSEDAVNAISSHWRNQSTFEESAKHCISSLDDLRDVAAFINDNPTLSKDELIQQMRSQLSNLKGDNRMLMNSVGLVARLFLMVNIQPISPLSAQSHSSLVPWPDTLSLANVLESCFPHTPRSQTTSSKKYARILNVYNLEKIGGFQIKGTDNLVDHLKFENDVVYLFYHVSLLRRMKESVSKDVLPSKFLDETLDSLALLVPGSNSDCTRWFREHQKNHFLDHTLLNLSPASRDINHYEYWGERLGILEEEFNESQPRTLSQWWFDKRKRVQWYTFWVAILVLCLTIIFGTVQTAAGIIQAWASVQSMKSTN